MLELRIRIMTWRNIPDQVRYWDAMDLLDNLEREMENARNGFLNCVFAQDSGFPIYSDEVEFVHLKPETQIKNDHLQLYFDELKGIEKDDIDISVEDGLFYVRVALGESSGKEVIGVFHMRVPPSFDVETCDAEMKEGKLVICMRKKEKKAGRKKVKVK